MTLRQLLDRLTGATERRLERRIRALTAEADRREREHQIEATRPRALIRDGGEANQATIAALDGALFGLGLGEEASEAPGWDEERGGAPAFEWGQAAVSGRVAEYEGALARLRAELAHARAAETAARAEAAALRLIAEQGGRVLP